MLCTFFHGFGNNNNKEKKKKLVAQKKKNSMERNEKKNEERKPISKAHTTSNSHPTICRAYIGL